jgi:ABC-type multidrug transport system ATPase subunit
MFGRSNKTSQSGTVTQNVRDDSAIVRSEGVVKTYHTGTDEVTALRGVDFAVTRGEMVAVMGPSGCGKTTLLNCLSGLDDVDSGRVWQARRAPGRTTRWRRLGSVSGPGIGRPSSRAGSASA